jgi:hypothetical protein
MECSICFSSKTTINHCEQSGPLCLRCIITNAKINNLGNVSCPVCKERISFLDLPRFNYKHVVSIMKKKLIKDKLDLLTIRAALEKYEDNFIKFYDARDNWKRSPNKVKTIADKFYENIMDMGCLTNDEINTVIEDYLASKKDLGDSHFGTVSNAATFIKYCSPNQIEQQKVASIICPVTNCTGQISHKNNKCYTCRNEICLKCYEISMKDHICDEDKLKTIAEINKDSKPCPQCNTSISKVSGCYQMLCIICGAVFDWESGELDHGAIHNPHYKQYLELHGLDSYRTLDDPLTNLLLFYTGNDALPIISAIVASSTTVRRNNRHYNTAIQFIRTVITYSLGLARLRVIPNNNALDIMNTGFDCIIRIQTMIDLNNRYINLLEEQISKDPMDIVALTEHYNSYHNMLSTYNELFPNHQVTFIESYDIRTKNDLDNYKLNITPEGLLGNVKTYVAIFGMLPFLQQTGFAV